MTTEQAIQLIEHPHFEELRVAQRWADLGAGQGRFTLALAHLFAAKAADHEIVAIDTNPNALAQLPKQVKGVRISTKVGDMKQAGDFCPYDGLIMANSLHYIRKKKAFFEAARRWMKPGAVFILVEYDTSWPNPWVPFPLTFAGFRQNATQWGLEEVEKINEKPSIYRSANIYAAFAKWEVSK